MIKAKNPRATVKKVGLDIFDISRVDLLKMISEADMVLDMTASERVALYLQELCFKSSRKPMIQSSVSMGGASGMIISFVPSASACLECLKSQGGYSLPIPMLDINSLEMTSPDYGSCSKPALPGSGVDTREVAIHTARLTLQLLSHEHDTFYPKSQGYQLYWHGPAWSKSGKPLEWEIKNIAGLTDCSTCNPSQ